MKYEPPKPLNDIQRWQIENLARNGGFSNRFITSYALHKKEPTKQELDQVSYYRLNIRALLTDWRNGITPESKAQVVRVMKGKPKPKKKAAAKPKSIVKKFKAA